MGTVIRFDDFALHEDAALLRAHGREVHLTPRAFDVLHCLLEARGALVTKDALFARCWRGLVVTDDALTRCIREIRHALGDSPRTERYVATVHRKGYRFAAALTAAESAPLDDVPRTNDPPRRDDGAAVVAPDLFGRDDALARGRRALNTAIASQRGAIVAISGEAGIGKSRVAAELLRHGRSLGALGLLGHAHEQDGAPPRWLWHCVLGDLERALGVAASRWAESAAPAQAAEQDGGDLRHAVAERIVSALREAAARSPVVLLLEDLHEADGDTLAALRHVASAIVDVPIVLLATWRDVGAPRSDDLAVTAARLAAAGCLYEPLALRGLEVRDVEAWLRARGADAKALAAPMLERTGGNPLFLQELWSVAGGTAAITTSLAESLGLREAIGRRLAALPAAVHDVLLLAASEGERFEPALLAECDGSTAQAVAEALRIAHAERLVQRDGDDHMRFVHGLLREGLLERAATARRWRAHERLARALEVRRTRGVAVPASALAAHWLEAEPTEEHRRAAVPYLRAAQDDALRACAFARAATWAARLLELERGFGDTSAIAAQTLALARVEAQIGRPAVARERARWVVATARARGAHAVFRDAVAFVADIAPAYPLDAEVRALLDEALAQSDLANDGTRARLLAQRSYRAFLHGEIDIAARDAGRARDLAQACDDAAALEVALASLSHVTNHRQDVAQWHDVTDARIALALRRGDRQAEFVARRQRLEQWLQAGDRAAFDDELQRFAAVVEELDTPNARAAYERTLAGIALAEGDLVAGERCARQAIALGTHSTDDSVARLTGVLQLGALGMLRGDDRWIAGAVNEAKLGAGTNSMLVAAEVYLRTRADRAAAAPLLTAAVADGCARLPRDNAFPVALCYLAVAADLQDDAPAAAALHACLEPYRSRFATVSCYFTCGPTDAYLGRLAAVLGRFDDAAHAFARALGAAQSMGFPVWQAGALRGRARAHERAGDRAAAQRDRDDAATLAASVGVVAQD